MPLYPTLEVQFYPSAHRKYFKILNVSIALGKLCLPHITSMALFDCSTTSSWPEAHSEPFLLVFLSIGRDLLHGILWTTEPEDAHVPYIYGTVFTQNMLIFFTYLCTFSLLQLTSSLLIIHDAL